MGSNFCVAKNCQKLDEVGLQDAIEKCEKNKGGDARGGGLKIAKQKSKHFKLCMYTILKISNNDVFVVLHISFDQTRQHYSDLV